MMQRIKFQRIAKVPFAHQRRAIAGTTEQLGKGHFRGLETMAVALAHGRIRKHHIIHPTPLLITARHQRRSRR